MADFPRSPEAIAEDYAKRRAGILRALTDDVEEFYAQCDPDKDNLCLYGERNGSWSVDLPAEEVPPELPEPCLGVNFARDGMARKDWLALVAVHSDAWLMAVAFFYAVKLDAAGRSRLFKLLNSYPTLFEVVTGRASKPPGQRPPQQTAPVGAAPAGIAKPGGHPPGGMGMKRKDRDEMGGGSMGPATASRQPNPQGRKLGHADVGPHLKGCMGELFWPDDALWYLVQIEAVNPRTRTAKIIYSTGEVEELDLDEIVRDGHMVLLGPSH